MVEEIDYARLAAFIDGEGNISIGRVKKKDRTHASYYLYICVSNTSGKLMDWLLKNFRGKKRGTILKSNNVYFKWNINGEKAVKILRKITPYLIIKQAQAILGIEFYEKCHLYKRWATLPLWSIEKRKKYYLKMKDLNGTNHVL